MGVKRPLLVVCLLSMTVILPACIRGNGVEAGTKDGSLAVSQSEQDFMKKAAQSNLAEVYAARIALQKTGNDDLRDYANMINSDHMNAFVDLSELMKDQNVPQPKSIAPVTQQDINRMSNLTGGEFDREFINMMVSDHQNTIEMFRDQQISAQNPGVKKYLEETLPRLEMHLEKAQRLQTRIFSLPNTQQNQPLAVR